MQPVLPRVTAQGLYVLAYDEQPGNRLLPMWSKDSDKLFFFLRVGVGGGRSQTFAGLAIVNRGSLSGLSFTRN